MSLRPANPDDAEALARLHVACWRETYRGLLPETEIAARDHAARLAQWQRQLSRKDSRTVIAPGLGFAQAGPQRDTALTAMGYADELYCLYLLQRAQGTGLGAALFRAVVDAGTATAAMVLDGNARACAFYAKMGGRWIDTRDEHIGAARIRERVYVWPAAGQAASSAS